MTRHGEGKSVNSTSPAKYERARRMYLVRSGKASIVVNYLPINNALEAAGLE
jgi:hypothetical protein